MKSKTKTIESIEKDYKHLEAPRLVFDLINGRQTPLGIIDAISQRLQQQQDTKIHTKDDSSLEDEAYETQALVIRLAFEAPFTHSHLVALLQAFYHCPDEAVNEFLWSNYGMNEGDAHSYHQYVPELAEEYININAFEARLWAAMGVEVEDYTLGQPIRNLVRAIEAAEVTRDFQAPDVEIAVACLWVIHGSPGIWALCKAGVRDGDGGHFWRGDLWTGEPGYSVARWKFWKGRVKGVAEGRSSEDVGVETVRLAGAALANMEAVEANDPEGVAG